MRAVAEKVQAMAESGEAKAAIAARLGLSGAEVKRMLDLVTRQGTEATVPTEEHAA